MEARGRAGWAHYVALGAVCALVVAVYAGSAKSGFLELWGEQAKEAYYNLLAQGFRGSQLHLNKKVPPGLAQLSDPYDPVANGPYRSLDVLHDLSFHRGKLYLYFGVTPALVLIWPWRELTGHFLWHRDAVLVFCTAGFLAGAGLLVAMWRRYFPELCVGVVAGCIAGLGLASGTLPLLARSDVYEVSISCGYAMTMLALLLIWCTLNAARRRSWWLAGASLAYALAVGARPSLLFGAAVLLVPVATMWLGKPQMDAEGRGSWILHLCKSAAAATGPMVLIGMGLMLYNHLRFENPFEFGQSYQLASDRQATIQHFSLSYLWFNLRLYFLSLAGWSGQFPFVRDILTGPVPLGHAEAEHAFGVLTNVPVVLLALAAPLAGRGREGTARSVLRGFGAGLAVLFGASAMTLGLYSYTIIRYQVEFVAPLMGLAVMGIFGLECALADRPVLRWGIRLVWGLCLTWSVAFNLLARYWLYSHTCYDLGLNVLHQGRADEAVAHFQKALGFQPANTKARNDLGATLFEQGKVAEAVRCLEVAVQLQPNDADARNNLGVMLFQLGRFPEAMDQYQEALRLDPGRVTACYNLGNALLRVGRPSEAAEHYERALRLKPDYVEARRNMGVARFQLGESLAAQGKWKEAVAEYQRALQLKPDATNAHVNLAWLLATCPDASVRNGMRAVQLAEQANQAAGGKDAAILDTLAAAYAEAGRFHDAVRTAQAALNLVKAAGQVAQAERVKARLQFYQSDQPYREQSEANR